MGRGAMVSISLLTASLPALAQTGEIPSALLSPPAPQHQQGRPSLQLQPGRLCQALQQTIRSVLGPQIGAWSITVLDENGALLADVNGTVPRVPASNQKLISTAFALDRLGTDFRLRTRLLRHPDGSLEIVGEGDPDLSIAEIQRFAMVALGEGGSRSTSTPSTPIRLLVREEPKRHWWPSDWQQADRTYAYGAPITRLALTSNALSSAVMNPAARLQRILDSTARQQGGRLSMVMVDHEQRERGASIAGDDTVVLHSEDSAPMHALLSLANTESHNFTAEVLLREAADDWDVNRAALANSRWLQAQGISTAGLRIRDGSGLSRGNRVTSRTLAELLLRMGQHPMASYYQASMAIAAQRGTLRRLYRGTPLEGRFWGKTGTLRGVRTLSGILETADGPRYVSMISNGGSTPNTVMGKVLRASQRLSRCA
ncbi:penicillin-binding-like protein Pbp4 [Synechococcus sp. A15-127]|uniref:D-alanyl-D-alanine carboxypeptidase/D-alanyl-D-alanine endopeptidase n=1 Tax=Synechococcus sp. A15-127 TaxID=1050624 RepID=UPI0016458688|nr:D-alanyl-D-alanine carboxypeptidase/D-alanyl-D-alanine-endopeptidase [Synechococcus sp. A15-127]QNI94473.1 penicillin-binding-like protein Pbp4 [Synechococcus sp. A15-127]